MPWTRLVIGAIVLVRAGLYAASGAGLILDDWSIVVNGGLARLWQDPNTTFTLSRPGAWVLLTVVNGGIGAHPLGLLAVVTLLQLTAAWLLYRVALRWVTPAVALGVTVLWLVMANHSSLTVWGPIIPALVALCLLLGGVLALGSGRWVPATAFPRLNLVGPEDHADVVVRIVPGPGPSECGGYHL
jgi:hypothetical protein